MIFPDLYIEENEKIDVLKTVAKLKGYHCVYLNRSEDCVSMRILDGDKVGSRISNVEVWVDVEWFRKTECLVVTMPGWKKAQSYVRNDWVRMLDEAMEWLVGWSG